MGQANYGTHEDCAFTFSGVGDLTVRSFGLESHPTCDWDYLKIGAHKYCGIGSQATVPPTTIAVEGTTAFTFKSDYSVTRHGFQICFKPDWFPVGEYASTSFSNTKNSMNSWATATTTATATVGEKPTAAEYVQTEAEKQAEAAHFAAKQKQQAAAATTSASTSSTAVQQDPALALASAPHQQDTKEQEQDQEQERGLAKETCSTMCHIGVAVGAVVAVAAVVAYVMYTKGHAQAELPTVAKPAATRAFDTQVPVAGTDVERHLSVIDISSQV